MKEVWYTRISTILLVGFVLLSVEYAVKSLMVNVFQNSSFSINSLLSIRYSANPNIAFGIPMPKLLICSLTLAILLVVSYYFVKFYRDARIASVWAANLIIWGAVGNFYDRLKYGHVVDYISFGNLTVFNISDALIVLGVVMLAFDLLASQRAVEHLQTA